MSSLMSVYVDDVNILKKILCVIMKPFGRTEILGLSPPLTLNAPDW